MFDVENHRYSHDCPHHCNCTYYTVSIKRASYFFRSQLSGALLDICQLTLDAWRDVLCRLHETNGYLAFQRWNGSADNLLHLFIGKNNPEMTHVIPSRYDAW